jgi:hypothetical protein
MKKILASLLVLALCAPAMADVAITAIADGQDVDISIAVSGGAVVRGLALTLDAGAGMTVDPSSASAVNADFNAYIDYYQANGVTELPGGSAHPLATVGAPGPLTAAVEDAVLCLGVLDQTGAQKGYGSDGDASGLLATITYTGSGDVCLSEDMFRGGIVGDNLGTVSVQVDCVSVGGTGCATCLGDVTGDNVVDLFNDLLNIALALDANGYADISPVPAELICADTDGNDVLDLFTDLLNIALALDANGYADIPCPAL